MIKIEDKSTLDPLHRKLYLVEYKDSYYWFRPICNRTDLWAAIKDDCENSSYNEYRLEIKNKIKCNCEGYQRSHSSKCKHTDILAHIQENYK